MSDKAIVPAVRIGKFYLGNSLGNIIRILERSSLAYERVSLGSAEKIVTDELVFWVRESRITQIMAYNGYEGKINGVIGIGCTLRQAEECLGRIKDGEFDIAPVYEVEGVPGVCFELKDSDVDDEFDEMTAPIETICIY